jgi:uncharacterized protein YndB with AHSA1/START domain
MSVTHADFTIERRYPYSPAQTFSAFAEPELRRRWFANPGGWDDAEWSLDFRVGGRERNAGGGREFDCRFHDIVADERIVYAYDLWHDGHLVSVSLATIEFGARDEGTALRFTEQGAFFDGEIAAAQREHGTEKLLDLLERFLAGEPVR